MATSFQVNALVGLGTLNLGVALAGLGISYAAVEMAGPYIEASIMTGVDGAQGFRLAAIGGLIILDGESGQELEFQRMSDEQLRKMGLTPEEALSYNENLEKLSTSFKVVSSSLTNDSTKEEAVELWQEQEEILGADAINGARKVLNFSIKNNQK